MELRFVEDGHENLFGENVLNHHFPNVERRDIGIDGFAAGFQELIPRLLKTGVCASLRVNHVPQRGQDGRQIRFKFVNRLPEIIE